MTPNDAKDEMLLVFRTAWPVELFARYPDVAEMQKPSSAVSWARVDLKHADGGVSSLANAAGHTLHTARGTLWVQVFAPMGDGGVAGYTLAKTVLDAYRAARGGVWYRKHRLRDVGPDGAWHRTDFLVDFTYDD